MIVVKLISGLGNQLFQYTLARSLALKHGVNIKIDTNFFKNQELRTYSLGNFNINANFATDKESEKLINKFKSNIIYKKIFYKIEKYIPLNFISYYQEKKWWVCDENIYKLKPPFYLEGYWQNHKYFKNLDQSIINELTLKVNLNQNAQETLVEIINDETCIAVHVRRGDYITDQSANNYMGVMPLSYYQNAFEIIRNKITNPSFFIFTDDITWAKQHLIVKEKTIFVAGNKDFEDLKLMQSCKHQIIANSSFSWWGAFLNTNPNKIVICPKNWLANNEGNKLVEIQMPEWIKI